MVVVKIEVVEFGLQFNRNEPSNARPIGQAAVARRIGEQLIHLAGCLIVRHRTQCSLIEEGKPAVGAVSYQLDTKWTWIRITDAAVCGPCEEPV